MMSAEISNQFDNISTPASLSHTISMEFHRKLIPNLHCPKESELEIGMGMGMGMESDSELECKVAE